MEFINSFENNTDLRFCDTYSVNYNPIFYCSMLVDITITWLIGIFFPFLFLGNCLPLDKESGSPKKVLPVGMSEEDLVKNQQSKKKTKKSKNDRDVEKNSLGKYKYF